MLYKIKEKISNLISKGFDKWMKVYEWAEKDPLHHAAWVGGTCILPLSLFACDLGQGYLGRMIAFYSFWANMIGAGIYSRLYSKRGDLL